MQISTTRTSGCNVFSAATSCAPSVTAATTEIFGEHRAEAIEQGPMVIGDQHAGATVASHRSTLAPEAHNVHAET